MRREMFEELDNLAWDIVCNWYKSVDFDPVYEGVDFSLLTRSILRSKVGRALRLKNSLINEEVFTVSQATSFNMELQNSPKLCQSLITFFKLKINTSKLVCYIPQYARPLNSLSSKLFEDKTFLCVTRDANIANQFVYPLKIRKSQQFTLFVENLCLALHHSLEKYGIILEAQERELLDLKIYELGDLFVKAKHDLKVVKPNFILCYSDESLPQMCYVLLAKNLGIKTISLQHGLDCENYYLEEPYADLILLWGKYRQNRYETSLNIFGSKFKIVGNPEYDCFHKTVAKSDDDKYWLYVSRPHSSDKCYAPSRLETEGILILNEILQVLKYYPNERLVIKPHPYDCIDEYKKAISYSGLDNQVEISDKPPFELYADAKFVVSEDSTAGLEAVMDNKHLIHVHFALSSYTIPFREYGVGLLATNGVELKQCVDRLMANQYNTIFDNSNREEFIKDLLYKLDGESTNRAVDTIKKELT